MKKRTLWGYTIAVMMNLKTTSLVLGLSLLIAIGISLFADVFDRGEQPQVLRINLAAEPRTLDPRHANDITSATVIRCLYDGLTRLDEKGVPQLAVAETVDVSDDQRVYTFHLRESVWADGTPVTAHDFVTSWLSVLEPTFPAEFASRLFVIKNARLAKEGLLPLSQVAIRAHDAHTLEITLEQATPHFLELLATYTFFPVQDKDGNGNGPFILKSWQHLDEIVLTRNPLYWDAERVQLDEIHMLMVEETATELALFDQGAIHWAGSPTSSLPLDAMPELRAHGQLKTLPVHSTYYYKCNTTHPLLSHPKIRHALSLAIDRQALVDHIWYGDHLPATSLVPPTLGGSNTLEFDPDKARALWQEALQELNLSTEGVAISYSKSDDHHKVAQAIQQQWREHLGFEVTLDNADWLVHLDKVAKGQYDIGCKIWLADYSSAQALLEPFAHRNEDHAGANNDTRWFNSEFTQLLSEGKMKQAETLWLEDLPAIPIVHITHRYVKSSNLKGVVFAPVGQIDFKTAYFIQTR